MANSPQDSLDKLLKGAYPAVEVSQDFKLRLWRKLMDQPVEALWKVPAPAVAAALLLGIVGGIWTWQGDAKNPALVQVARAERLDLFGNAPHDSLTGAVLRRMEGENA
ncbi:MAG: hypothetical protein Q7J69_06245 [Candidatus Omnitrophota bacterium]|nr:hypothetical protein [Candidatus Omnitrophota bacterium]